MNDTERSNFTRLLQQVDKGDSASVDRLFEVVYDELRKLALSSLIKERRDITLQATALVHEAWLRLAGPAQSQEWESRRHFFGAASEAIRRILVDHARRRAAQKRGGGSTRDHIDLNQVPSPAVNNELLCLHEALDRLATHSPIAAELIKLRYFGGFTIEEVSEILGVSRTSAHRQWVFAKAWLKVHIERMNDS